MWVLVNELLPISESLAVKDRLEWKQAGEEMF